MSFAVIKTGGKQYKVSEGDVLTIEKLAQAEGEVLFDQVLLVTDGEKAKIGQPFVSGAAVSAKIIETGKGEKKMVFKYKAKTRYRKKKGHRQQYAKVQITNITA